MINKGMRLELLSSGTVSLRSRKWNRMKETDRSGGKENSITVEPSFSGLRMNGRRKMMSLGDEFISS